MKKNYSAYCVGIDGCKDGWVAVYCPAFSFNRSKVRHYKKLSQLTEDFSQNSTLVIDIPIGLETDNPNRTCDIEARRFLGSRSSTIFSPPCLDAIRSPSYEEAKVLNLIKTGKSISKQSWFLSKKILEAKKFNENEMNLNEGHPECSFAEYLGKPILANKKGMRGIFKRLAILSKLNFKLPDLVEMLPENANVSIDDLLDAAILSWSASRVSNGKSKTFPNSNNNRNSKDFFIHV